MDQIPDSVRSEVATKIWWLASYPKSGNTWLRMFLSAYRHGGVVDINQPSGLLVDDIQPYFTHVCSPKPVQDLNDGERMLLRPAALLHLVSVQKEGRPLFVKTHFANCRIAGVDAIPATLTHGAVYLVRDPRDVAVSFAEHKSAQIDEVIEGMGRDNNMLRREPLYQVLSTWSAHVKSWTRARGMDVLVVRYEDMVAAPRQAFAGILSFLRHEVDDTLLDKAVEATEFACLQQQETASGFREKAGGESFFTRGRPGGWRDALTDAQAARIETDHGAIMREFGYL